MFQETIIKVRTYMIRRKLRISLKFFSKVVGSDRDHIIVNQHKTYNLGKKDSTQWIDIIPHKKLNKTLPIKSRSAIDN